MDQLKELLTALLSNQLDRVKVIYNLLKLKQSVDEDAPFIILKYKLQLELIQNISKQSNHDDVYLSTLKKETLDYLEFHQMKRIETGFSCCLVGCLYKTGRHRNYIRHLKQSHSNASSFSCQFGHQCKRTFASVDLLMIHIDQVHSKVSRSSVPGSGPAPADVPCKCIMLKCSGRQFSNTRSFMLHLRNDHVGESIKCIFEGCEKQLVNSDTIRKHFYLKHTKSNWFTLKTVHKVLEMPFIEDEHDDALETSSDIGAVAGVGMEESLPAEEAFEDQEDVADNDNDEHQNKHFMMSFCDFLNRLSNFQFVPQTTIKIIASEYLKNYTKSNEAKLLSLRKQLETSSGLSESDKERIIAGFEKDDFFLVAQTNLDTEYRRNLYLRENFIYIPPVEILLNPKSVKKDKAPKDVMHYVSVIESFKNLIQDSSFLAMEERNIVPELETLGDVKDGELYKQNPFFMANPSAYTMMLYSDAIELVNPLGAGRGKHKVIQIFFSLCEISKHLRSKIDRIQLVAVFKEKLIKKYGFKKLYEQLVKDLKKLEEGVVVDFPVKRVVKCGVLIHPCDNLEAHTVGGFSQSFSSGFICRFCHIKHKDLLDNIHDYGDHPHAKWTCMEYDRAALAAEKKIQDAAGDAAEEELYSSDDSDDSDDSDCIDDLDDVADENDSTKDASDGDESQADVELGPDAMFGVKHECPLNCLQAFHSTTSFPPDILHDLFEGKLFWNFSFC
jgi:hypothetical protein